MSKDKLEMVESIPRRGWEVIGKKALTLTCVCLNRFKNENVLLMNKKCLLHKT